jgi:hypothetical protein
MKAKKKLCAGCDQEKYIWKKDGRLRYCKDCWFKTGVAKKRKPTVFKPQKPMRQKSSKMSSLDSVYSMMRINYLNDYPMCQAKVVSDCMVNSTDVHHKKGRGKYHLDVTTWLSTCRQCHMWIEEHPKEAIELGLSIKRDQNE